MADRIKATVKTNLKVQARSMDIGSVQVTGTSLSSSTDIDLFRLQDGGILVWETATRKWTATNNLDRHTLEGGVF